MIELSGPHAHALIIEDNMIMSRAIEAQLMAAGFRSIDHARTRARAMTLARAQSPDVVVLGEHVDQWAGIAAAQELSHRDGTAVMMVTTDPQFWRRPFPEDVPVRGPYRIDQLSRAFGARRQGSAAPVA
ncbi:response regulator [Sphingobium lignivorans]|uniref:ActR/RegA family two-component response regulator n=1 Tax=Sphingobium lignivorans TaxID=2735886 RepID=A0ABR6NBS2_9SPHN|nr:response regulator [Sphingobium lignivorans]MBB5984689.1 ActR/RegA family two-component response regulator [Sphingobium lignivorans]